MALSDMRSALDVAWLLDETSGTRAALVGGLDLTDNNTTPSAAGIFGNASDHDPTQSEYLSHADDALLRATTAEHWAVGCWAYLDDADAARTLMGKWGNSGNEWILEFDGDPAVPGFYAQKADNSGSTLRAWSGSVTTGAWHLVVAKYDQTNDRIGLSIDGANFLHTNLSGAGIRTGTSSFRIGAYDGSNAFWWDGRVDEPWILTGYDVTNSDVSALWDGGSGVSIQNWSPRRGSNLLLLGVG